MRLTAYMRHNLEITLYGEQKDRRLFPNTVSLKYYGRPFKKIQTETFALSKEKISY